MKILADFLPFLKEQTEYHDRQLVRFRSDPTKKRRHEEIAKTFRELVAAALAHQTQSESAGPISSPNTALTPADLAGLPPELLEQLNLSESDAQDMQIINVVNAAGGVMSLDKLLIAIYRQTGEVHKRPKLTARLYRMVQKGIIFTVPKKKGLYTTTQPESE